MLSLKDKLMQAGLVTEEQAKKAESQPAPAAPARRPSFSPPVRNPVAESRIPKLPPLPGSRQHQREESKKQLELDRALRELVVGAEVPVEVGATTFHFVTRKGKLRRLELSEAQAKKLELGELAVVERPDPGEISHALVPPETAFALMPLSHRAVRFFAREGVKVGFVDGESEEPVEAAAASSEVPAVEAPAAAPASVEEKPAPMIAIKRRPL